MNKVYLFTGSSGHISQAVADGINIFIETSLSPLAREPQGLLPVVAAVIWYDAIHAFPSHPSCSSMGSWLEFSCLLLKTAM